MKANEPGIILTFFWFSTSGQANTGRQSPGPRSANVGHDSDERGLVFVHVLPVSD